MIVFKLLDVAPIWSVDYRFGETDLPVDDIAAVFLMISFPCVLVLCLAGKRELYEMFIAIIDVTLAM